ncbi:MAG: glutamate racemase [Myxococcales bacterium]|nr:glutamate racemase [Myxococcales bacterium]
MSGPIGVYDSGFGGLSVLRALRTHLPEADFVYLGDSGRAPYGGRDVHTILDLAEQCVERLFDEGAAVVIVACHTVSSVALRHLQARYGNPMRRVLGVTIPAAESAVRVTRGRIGFLGTARTVASGTFSAEVHKLAPVEVIERAAPLLAPIVEEGWEQSEVASAAVTRYLHTLGEVDTVVLGCTHYPLLRRAFEGALGPDVTLLDPAPHVAERLVDWVRRHPGFVGAGAGDLRALTTGEPGRFAELGARFLGTALPGVECVHERDGRLVSGSPAAPAGQVVR